MSVIDVFAFIALVTGVTSIVLSIVISFNKNKYGRNKKIKFIFGFLTAFLGLWSLSYYFWLSADNKEQAMFWIGMLNIGSTFIPIVYYHWIVVLLNKNRNVVLYIGYTITVVFALFSFSNLYFIDVISIAGFPFWPQAGPLYIYYIIFLYFGFYILSILELVHSIRYDNLSEKSKSILKIILIAFSVSLAAGATNFPLWFGIMVLPYGNYVLIFVHVFLIAYAILKYDFMDMRTFYVQLVVGLILAVSAINIFISRSESFARLSWEIFLFLILISFSYLLVKSSRREIKQSEELLKLSNNLKRANVELKRLDRAKSEFISIASHQLRTPLTAIKGYISLMLEGAYGKNAPETEGALNKIFLANERLIQLVEDLLNITRIESGRLEYHLEEGVQVDDIVDELKDMFILRTQEKGLEFVIKSMNKKATPIKADKAKLREVISNIIDNAIKYTKEGFVYVSIEEDKRSIRVIVEDSGVGISPESLKTLFTKFGRGTDDTKMYTEGTGLGLYVGRNLIESQGGHIQVESDGIGEGSRFTIEMPIG